MKRTRVIITRNGGGDEAGEAFGLPLEGGDPSRSPEPDPRIYHRTEQLMHHTLIVLPMLHPCHLHCPPTSLTSISYYFITLIINYNFSIYIYITHKFSEISITDKTHFTKIFYHFLRQSRVLFNY